MYIQAGPEMALPFLFQKLSISADMSDGVKLKRPIHCPLFYRGFFISYAGHCRLAMSAIHHNS